MQTRQDSPNRFLRHWLLNALIIWPIAGIASIIVWIPVAVVMSMLGRYDDLMPLVHGLSLICLLTLPGMTIGYMIGDFQRSLMREHLNWQQRDWIRLSVLGGLLGEWLVVGITFVIAGMVPEKVQLMLMLPLFVLPLGVAQWWSLRRTTRDAWLWILANITGAMVFSGVFFMNPAFPFVNALDIEPLTTLALWALAASSLGIITGVVILWLYDHPVEDGGEWEDDPELARVHVEVYTHDKRR